MAPSDEPNGIKPPDGNGGNGSPGREESASPFSGRGHSIIVLGTSAGGVEALTRLVRDLSPEIPAALFIVQHFPATSRSLLAQILRRAGHLPAEEARHGDEILSGRIYVAPNDRHLLVHRGHVALSTGPRENRCRPAIDPLFRSAARSYGARAVGVVLTGNLDDGTAGLQAIKSAGGIAVVQDPADAPYSGMPRSAMENVDVDHVLPLAQIPSLLLRLAQEPIPEMEETTDATAGLEDVMTGLPEPFPGVQGQSVFTCPECHGSMIEIKNGDTISFRCHVGHVFSPESLADSQVEKLEQAMWSALAALEESIELSRKLARRARDREHTATAKLFEKRVEEQSEQAALLRQALYRGTGVEPPQAKR